MMLLETKSSETMEQRHARERIELLHRQRAERLSLSVCPICGMFLHLLDRHEGADHRLYHGDCLSKDWRPTLNGQLNGQADKYGVPDSIIGGGADVEQ